LEYVFLKRKPKIFLVGDPIELGYPLKDGGTDRYGISWSNALHALVPMIFANEEIAEGLMPEWLGDVFYWVETPYIGVPYDVQGYTKFGKLLRDAKKTGNTEKLFEYSPPIDAYAIPPDGTKEREKFSRYVRTWDKLTGYYDKKLKEAEKKLQEALDIIKGE